MMFNDVCHSVTNVTVKDAPYEMNDDSLMSAFEKYGEVVRKSTRRGVVKGTSIQTGTRYLGRYDANEIIPTIITVEDFELRVFCDNSRTECKHCSLKSYPHYKCPVRPKKERSCFRYFSVSQDWKTARTRWCAEFVPCLVT